MPRNAREALALALIQINLAEAEYNVGRWDEAEARLRPLDLACWLYPITRTGLRQQRAWIAAHRGRAVGALELCASADPRGLPRKYRAEYHFTRAVALLASGRVDDAEGALDRGAKLAQRISSKRNVLFLRARLAAARDEWDRAERLCSEAVRHRFRGQGGAGILLWAEALRRLGRQGEADAALRLVAERDPESEAAAAAAGLLGAPAEATDVPA
jgi:tetratricopeptide (TPR) repeat protein